MMWRWTKRIVMGLVGLVVMLVGLGVVYQWAATRADLAATPPPGELVDVGGHRLHLWCVGDGRPVVVHDGGIGGNALAWTAIKPDIAAFTRICTYDRAGMGYSDPGPMPRTSRQVANELAVLLERADIEPPVVLVGTSFGGWTVRVLASERPDLVGGLVLLDAPHEDERAREEEIGLPSDIPPYAPLVPVAASLGLLRLAGISLGLPPDMAPSAVRDYARATAFRTSRFQTMASELLSTPDSAAQVRNTRRPLDLPLVVLSAGRLPPGPPGAIHRELQEDQATLSRRSCHITPAEAGHGLAGDAPALVVAAVRAVVHAVHDPSQPLDCDLL